MKKQIRKDDILRLRINKDLKNHLYKYVNEQNKINNLTVSQFVRYLIIKHLTDHGVDLIKKGGKL